jgi:3-isopropylmalate/(R)-2-methylmalate dehydratase small subunit
MSSAKISRVIGRAVPLRGDDIDTDRIIPARYLRCVTFDGLGEHAFEDDRAQDPEHPFNQAKYEGATILIAGRNFGCGSSREHAPQSLARWGISGIIGQSFAEIFFGNCCNLGIPCFTVSAEDGEALFTAVERDPALKLEMDVATATVRGGDREIQASLAAGVREVLLEGTWNATMVLLEAEAEIAAVAEALPYCRGFSG